MRNGFIYEWTNTTNGLKYIGRHEGQTSDGYIGSGPRFVDAYNKNPDHFKRIILWEGDIKSSYELAVIEDSFLGDLSTDELYYGSNRKYYNQVNNSYGFTSEDNPMKNQIIVEKMKATRIKLGLKDPHRQCIEKYGVEGYSKLLSENGVGNTNGAGNAGKEKSILHKEKISIGITEWHITNKGSTGRKPINDPNVIVKLVENDGYIVASEQLGVSVSSLYHSYRRAKKKLEV